MPNLYFSFPNLILIFLALSIALLLKIGITKADKKKYIRIYYLYLIGIMLFCIVAALGFFPQTDSFPPRFPLMFIYSFLFFFIILFQKIDTSLSFLKSIPMHWLIYFQSFRIILEIIIDLLYKEKIVPEEITFEGRSFDMLVGVAALLVGYLLYKGKSLKIGIAFNIFGLLSIINIVSIAVPSFPSPFRIYDVNFLPTYFPGILVPLFLAPVAIYIHLLSLKQLLWAERNKTKISPLHTY